jgi:hypothetical protein
MPPDDILLNKAAIIERCVRRMLEEARACPQFDDFTHLDAASGAVLPQPLGVGQRQEHQVLGGKDPEAAPEAVPLGKGREAVGAAGG